MANLTRELQRLADEMMSFTREFQTLVDEMIGFTREFQTLVDEVLHHLGLNLTHLNFLNYQVASLPKSKIQNPKFKDESADCLSVSISFPIE
ncbi:hypothetical protein [Microseira wollei]|uniref:Uncharacterized protein n=1 Tax=Microseira wollei NIES-4236 TaxID=2530354 RepID=A0AAV3XCL7_9CYAN|nr:hypothetical protein [Microseira wollei]GET40637.1 hypothetical protein MiSe_54480 [Microseira wollei NIES-4236]